MLKLHNTASYGNSRGGGIAVYNLTGRKQFFSFSPADIPDLNTADNYWVYEYFEKRAFSLTQNEKYEGSLEKDGYKWFVILPCGKNGSCLGLLDKYAGFSAVKSICENNNGVTAVLHESGTTGWISDKKPQKILINNIDYTEKLEQKENVCVIKLPEIPSKIVYTLIWE